MAESEVLTAARTLITKLAAWDGPSGDWNRLEASQETVRVEDLMPVWQWLAEQVVDADGRVLPVTATMTSRSFVATADDLTRISQFNIEKSNSQQEFQQRRSSLHQRLHEVLLEIGLWACQHAARRADKPTGKVSDQLREAEQKLEQIRDHEREAKAARESAKSAAAKAGAAVFTDSFKGSALAAQRDSRKWLCVGAVFAGATMLAAVAVASGWLGLGLDSEANAWLLLQPLTGRLFLLTILTYVTVWCGRRSLAERHNSRVNEHRANSLQTIQAFRESANADPTKDAVVLEAARAIFENVETGDLGGNPDKTSIANIIELVRPRGR